MNITASLGVSRLPSHLKQTSPVFSANIVATVPMLLKLNKTQFTSFLRSSHHYCNSTSISTLAKNRCVLLRCKASQNGKDDNNKNSASFFSPLSPEVTAAIDTPLLRIWLPLAVFLGILMLIDAAYSGDWSRIGALSKEQELQLHKFVPIAIGGHAVCAVVAGSISKQRGESTWILRSVKTLASGFVGLVEVILLPEEKES